MKKIAVIVILMCVSCNFFEKKKESESPKKLIGTWYADGYRNSKWVYGKDGTLSNYYDEKLMEVFKYSVCNTCGNNTVENDTIEYIKLKDKDSTEYCFKIIGINKNNNGVLSIKNMDTGVTEFFVNDVNAAVKH